LAFLGVVRMSSAQFFKIQRVGLAGFALALAGLGLLLLMIAVAGRFASSNHIAELSAGISYVYWFLFKVAIFMYLFIWYRATWPRYRFDQLMKVGWKVLLPIGLALLILTAVVGMRTELLAQVKEVLHR